MTLLHVNICVCHDHIPWRLGGWIGDMPWWLGGWIDDMPWWLGGWIGDIPWWLGGWIGDMPWWLGRWIGDMAYPPSMAPSHDCNGMATCRVMVVGTARPLKTCDGGWDGTATQDVDSAGLGGESRANCVGRV